MPEFEIGDQLQLLYGGPVMTVDGMDERRVHVAFVVKGRSINCWIDRRMLKPIALSR